MPWKINKGGLENSKCSAPLQKDRSWLNKESVEAVTRGEAVSGC